MSRIRQDINAMTALFLLLAFLGLLANAFTVIPLWQRQPTASVSWQRETCLLKRSISLHFSSSTNQETLSVEAETMFRKSCDKDGLMTREALKKMKLITELLSSGDLMEEELDEMWQKVPKFPESFEERIDMDSFLQIYRDIDELFEDDEEEELEDMDVEEAALEGIKPVSSTEEEDAVDILEENVELAGIFKSIADGQGLLTKETLLEWEEVRSLMDDNMLDEEEFSSIWDNIPKMDGKLDLSGFLKFNEGLDALFDFEDFDDLDEEGTDEAPEATSEMEIRGVVEERDLSPAALYEALADSDGLVGMSDLKRWGELQEWLADGDLVPLELENFFDAMVKSEKQPNKLNRDGFLALYAKIDSLFEGEEDDEEPSTEPLPTSRTKEQLLLTVDSLNQNKDRLPCGLESTESEQRYVKELVSALEGEETNEVRLKQGSIGMTDLVGEWELLYTSSSAMAYNKGLSGLGGSFPNGSFGGLKMKLKASKFLTDVEYTERIKVVPDSASFDVTVNGCWDVRSSVSLFTGQPSIVLTVVPDKVTYGPTSTRADHWKSLGPTNMLDLSYLDENLRIMRGNTNTDSILIFKRTK